MDVGAAELSDQSCDELIAGEEDTLSMDDELEFCRGSRRVFVGGVVGFIENSSRS